MTTLVGSHEDNRRASCTHVGCTVCSSKSNHHSRTAFSLWAFILLLICAHVLLCSLQLAIHHSDTYYPAIRQTPDRFDSRHLVESLSSLDKTRNATEPRFCRVAGWPVKRGWGALCVTKPSYPLHNPGWPKGRRGETDGCQGSPNVERA